MAKHCSICGKQIKMMELYSRIKDGYICEACCNDCGYPIPSSSNTKILAEMTREELMPVSSQPKELVIDPLKSADEQLNELIVQDPHITLKRGEVCLYQGTAAALHMKSVSVGSKSGLGGFSFHVAKGVTFHTGGGSTKNVRQNVLEKYSGEFFVTNLRLVLLTAKYGFDLSVQKINQFATMADGFTLYAGAKSYAVETKEAERISTILQLLNQSYLDKEERIENEKKALPKKTPSTKKNAEEASDPYEELKKLKELLDMGIVTEEEFTAKKKQLLGI